MSLPARFEWVLKFTVEHRLTGKVQQEFAALLTPMNLAIMAGTLAAWAVSHAFGYGFVVDALLLIVGAGFLGFQVISAGVDFCSAVWLTGSAKTQNELEAAADLFAGVIATVGVAAFSALVMKGAARAAPAARAGIAGATARLYGGMTQSHYRIFQAVAREQNRIIGVRFTNENSTRLIEFGCPPKPITVKIHTSPTTGIVTAISKAEKDLAYALGYYVVEPFMGTLIARRKLPDVPGSPERFDVLKFESPPFWELQEGQLIHAAQQKPLVGDYDLAWIIDPGNPTPNMVLGSSRGKMLLNWTNPEVKRIAAALNARMDQPRVLHGAHDGFADVASAKAVMVFFPDNSVVKLSTPEAVSAWYGQTGRIEVIKPPFARER
jgi:hypothetical protein